MMMLINVIVLIAGTFIDIAPAILSPYARVSACGGGGGC